MTEGSDGRRRGKMEIMEGWRKKNEGWKGWMNGEGESWKRQKN